MSAPLSRRYKLIAVINVIFLIILAGFGFQRIKMRGVRIQLNLTVSRMKFDPVNHVGRFLGSLSAKEARFSDFAETVIPFKRIDVSHGSNQGLKAAGKNGSVTIAPDEQGAAIIVDNVELLMHIRKASRLTLAVADERTVRVNTDGPPVECEIQTADPLSIECQSSQIKIDGISD